MFIDINDLKNIFNLICKEDLDKDTHILIDNNELDKNKENKIEIENYINQFEDLYSNNKRHKYAEIRKMLETIIPNDKDKYELYFNKITYIINECIKHLEKTNNTLSLIKNLEKLNDYICVLQDEKIYKIDIEILRKQYNDYIDKYKKQQENIKRTKNELFKLKQEVIKSKDSYIVILGIFASILLAFIGDFVFVSSIFQNIDKTGIFKLGFVFSLAFLFCGNLIIVLLSYINSIRGIKTNNKLNEMATCFNVLLFSFTLTFALLHFFTKC
ncbi:hypothetical protein [Campylobacter sp. MG1]|uniref:hypothetical protein n=1 Tax=Campylobacter sp. MG1 TaxID=2976332 RepID=UPI00226D0AAB|nr:hypothetical protein [Campylobacter sp. MG1]